MVSVCSLGLVVEMVVLHNDCSSSSDMKSHRNRFSTMESRSHVMAVLCFGSGIHRVLEILYHARPLESNQTKKKKRSIKNIQSYEE